MRRRSQVAPESIPENARPAAEALKEELDPTVKPVSRITFGSANRGDGKEDELHEGFQKIVESVFVENPWEEYKRLEAKLHIGQEGRALHATVNGALDEAETNARKAHRLWMTARVERSRWELANAAIFGAAKIEATRILQHEKDEGKRNKQITDADVEAMLVTKFGDEWLSQQNKRKR